MTFECLPHMPVPSMPKRALPIGACDCHSHVILPQSEHPFVENRSYTPPPATLESYKSLHSRLGIDRAVIVQPSVYGTDNSVTLNAIGAYGPNCRGIAVIDSECSDATLQAFRAGGIRGIRINLLFAGGDVGLDQLEPLAHRVAELGWHFQLLVDGPTLAALEPRLAVLPIPVVIDHMGHVQVADGLNQPGFVSLQRLVGQGNTWVKLSGNYRMSNARPHFEDVIPFARALLSENPDAMVWGTDWPHPAMKAFMPDDGALTDQLEAYFHDDAERMKVLVSNPARLYGFSDADLEVLPAATH